MHKWRSALMALVVAVAFGAAGCGNDDTDAYRDDVRAIGDRFEQSIGEFTAQAPGGATPDALQATFDGIADRFDTAANELDELDPPSDAESEHDAVVTALRDGAATLRESAQRLIAAQDDPAALQQEVARVTTDLEQVQTNATEALTALEEKVGE